VTPRRATVNSSYAGRDAVDGLLGLLQTVGTELVATIDGVSMTPTIAPGTRVRLRHADVYTLRSGDVVAFEYNGRLMAHRIVRIGRTRASRGYLLTRGDAMPLNDVPVRLECVIGIVTAQQIAGSWVALGRARDGSFRQAISGMIVAVIGGVFELSPTAAARSTRWTARVCAWTASRCAAPGLARAPARATTHAGPPSGDFIHVLRRQFSLEQAFLVALLGRKDAGRERLLEVWSTQIDWRRLQQITSPDLLAYLGHVLAQRGLMNRCPPRLQEQVLNRQRFTAAQWLRWRLELRNIVRAFREHGIDLILLKGAVLTSVAYPDTCLRSMSDLDLLVQPLDAERALRLIEAGGFGCPDYYGSMHPELLSGRSAPATAEIAVPLQKSGTRAFVELHTQLESAEPAYPVPTARLWEGAEDVDLCGLPCRTLEKHEFLLHLIMHLSEHHVFEHGLRALLDVHLWIERHNAQLDWQLIADKARSRGYAQWVYLSLRMVRDALATPVPDAALAALGAPAQLAAMQQLAYEQVLAEGRIAGNLPHFLIKALAQPTVSDAARLVLRRLLPRRTAMPPTMVRTLAQPEAAGVGLAVRRLRGDLRTRVPQYIRAWRAGRMRWSSLKRAAKLLRRADQLRELMRNPRCAGVAPR
jgi:signal peptidase I